MPTYKIIDPTPDDLTDCTVTVCLDDDGRELWRAWTPAPIDVATVLNVDHFPTIADERTTTDTTEISFRVATVDEAQVIYPPHVDQFGRIVATTEDQHRVMAAYAAVLELVDVADAAKACGLPKKALIDEALGWEAAKVRSAKTRRGS
jgi:hypothetical protein